MLESKEILAGNNLIAKFVGMEPTNLPGFFDTCGDYFNTNFTVGSVPYDEAMFHSSWDWLMPVVEKIEKLLNDHHKIGGTFVIENYGACVETYNYYINDNHLCSYYSERGDTKIEGVWKTCVKFCKWYETNIMEITTA